MIKKTCLALLCIVFLFTASSALYSQQDGDTDKKDDTAATTAASKKDKMPYKVIVALGADRSFSAGTNKISPIVGIYYFKEDFANDDLYFQFTLTTTTLYAIFGIKNKKMYTGIKAMGRHSVYAGDKCFNRGYYDQFRAFGGNNFAPIVFFKYNFHKIFSAKVEFDPSYHWYRMILISPNVDKYPKMPKRHWELSPSIELTVADLEKKDLMRVKHGYEFKAKYMYTRRIGYGTWYDYERYFYRDWWNGTYYRSSIKDTHRLYANVGLYYNFKGDYNIQFDYAFGYFKGLDRNNREAIGFFNADHAMMPGYFYGEFYHTMYMIARVNVGIPIPFWGARIQPGYNVLYMPENNDVVGVGRNGAQPHNINYLFLDKKFPRTIYTSVSLAFSIKLGNLLPIFIDYGYGIDAMRVKSAHKLYLRKIQRGNHELRVFIMGAFLENK